MKRFLVGLMALIIAIAGIEPVAVLAHEADTPVVVAPVFDGDDLIEKYLEEAEGNEKEVQEYTAVKSKTTETVTETVEGEAPIKAKATTKASGSCGNNVKWVLDSDYTLTISGSGAMKDFSSSSEQPWYNYAEDIKNIVVESGVTKIGDYAFALFFNVTDFSIAATVVEYGNFSFFGTFLNSEITINLSNKLESIGYGAFAANYNLKGFKVKDGSEHFCAVDGNLYDINKQVLIQAGKLTDTKISLPSSVIAIYPYAMSYGDYTLFEHSNIQVVGASGLMYCDNLEMVKLDALTGIGDSAFGGCTSLKSFTVPAGVTDIYPLAFAECTSLSSITFKGNAPTFGGNNIFSGVTATAYYDSTKTGWTSSVRQNYGGTIMWKDTAQKSTQTITASNFDKFISTSAQTFSLGASAKGGAALSYSSDNSSITVNSAGNCTIKANYIGKANITITAAETNTYKSATKTITVKSYPVKATITSLTYTNNNIVLKMKKDIGDVQYQIEYATNAQFEDSVLYEAVAYSDNGYIIVKNPTVGKTYYVRMRGRKVVDGTDFGGLWSETKQITISTQKIANTITASNKTATVSSADQTISLGASAKGGATLSYSSDNSSVTVNSSGKVTIKKNFAGIATITITAAATSEYEKTTKTVSIVVYPKKATITSLAVSGTDVVLKVNKDIGDVDYDIEWATNASFSNGDRSYNLSYEPSGYLVRNLEAGKTYYFRVRGSKITNGKGCVGEWSDTKTITIPGTKKAQTITAKNITKTVSSSQRKIAIGATCKGNVTLTYKSDNSKIKIENGKVVIPKNFVGKATITITAKETSTYKKATKKITVTINKKVQTITAKNISKTVTSSERKIAIGATRKGSAKLTYKSSNSKIKVTSGKVVIPKNFIGKATITITAAATSTYKKATKTITVTVKPVKASITSLTNGKNSKGEKIVVLKIKKNTGSVNYQIQYAKNSSFTNAKGQEYVAYNSNGYSVGKLEKGKTYYFRVRGRKKVNGTYYNGAWSEVKKIKAK